MSQENVEIIRRTNAAFNRGDVQAALESYSRQIEWRDLQHPPDSPELVSGIEAVERILSGWLDAFPDLRGDVREFIDAGDVVICVTNWRGMGKGSGAPVDEVTAETFELRHGEIVRATFGYRSKDEALEAAGLSESAMPTENVEQAKRALDAYNRRDVEALLEELDPEIEWHPALPVLLGGEATVYRGYDGVRKFFRETDDVLGEVHVEYSEIRDVGDRVVAIGNIRTRGKASGISTESPVATVSDLRNGRVIRLRTYLDPKEALEAAGVAE